jgi:hypothetical protein
VCNAVQRIRENVASIGIERLSKRKPTPFYRGRLLSAASLVRLLICGLSGSTQAPHLPKARALEKSLEGLRDETEILVDLTQS